MAQVKTPTSNLFALLDTEPTRKERDEKNTKTSGAPAPEVVLTPKQRSELKAKENEEKKLAREENERQRIEFEKNLGGGFAEPRYLTKKTQRVEVRNAPKPNNQNKGGNRNNRPNNKQGDNKAPNNANRGAGGNTANRGAGGNNNAVNRAGGNNNANRDGANKPRNNNFEKSNGGNSPVVNRQAPRQNKGGNYNNERKNNNPSGNNRDRDRQSQGKTSNKPPSKKGGAGQANWGESVTDGEDATFASGAVITPNVGVVSGTPAPGAPALEENDAPVDVEDGDEEDKAIVFSYDEFLAQREKKQKELEELGVVAKVARSLTDQEKAPANFTHVQSVKFSSNEPWALSATDKTATATVGTTVGARKGATVLEAEALQFRVAGPRPGGRGRGGRGGRGDDSRRDNDNERRNNNAAGRAGGERGRGGARGGRGKGDGRGKTRINAESLTHYPVLGEKVDQKGPAKGQ